MKNESPFPEWAKVVFEDFRKVTGASFVNDTTFDVDFNENKYRIEITATSNKNDPYSATVFVNQNNMWQEVEDFPWVGDKSPEDALRSALGFLEDEV